MSAWLLLLTFHGPAEGKPPGLGKALSAMLDPATGARAALDAIRGQAAALGPVDGPLTFAAAVTSAWPMFGPEEAATLRAEAEAGLDAASAAAPDRRAEVEAARGQLRLATGDPAGAEQAWRASIAARPSLAALAPLLDRVPAAEVAALCASARASVPAHELPPLVDTCNAHGDPLAWASPADKEAWAAWRADEAAAVAAFEARRAAETAARASAFTPAPAPVPSPRPAPTGPTTTSVSIRSACRQTVRVFFGQTPKFGSGTTTTISANSVSSYTMRPGDTIWLVDEHDNGLSSTSVSGSSQRIEIVESCTGFRTY